MVQMKEKKNVWKPNTYIIYYIDTYNVGNLFDNTKVIKVI
jgi:hypothetical protein